MDSDKVAFLNDGELVEFGEPEELLKVRSVQKFVFHPSPGFNT